MNYFLAVLLAILLAILAVKLGLELPWIWTLILAFGVGVIALALILWLAPGANILGWAREHLIDDAWLIWKRWSVWILSAQAVVTGTWSGLALVGLTPALPEWAKGATVLVFTAAALAVMPIQQRNLTKDGG